MSLKLNKFADSEVDSRDPVYDFCRPTAELYWGWWPWRHNDVIVEKIINIVHNSRGQTAMFLFQFVDRIRQQLSWASCEFVFTPPTRRDSTVESRRRRRSVLGLIHVSAIPWKVLDGFSSNLRGMLETTRYKRRHTYPVAYLREGSIGRCPPPLVCFSCITVWKVYLQFITSVGRKQIQKQNVKAQTSQTSIT